MRELKHSRIISYQGEIVGHIYKSLSSIVTEVSGVKCSKNRPQATSGYFCSVNLHFCHFLDYVSREQLLLHVTRSNDADISVEHRLVWCPYVVSGATNNDDIEHLFAVALGKSVSVFAMLCVIV